MCLPLFLLKAAIQHKLKTSKKKVSKNSWVNLAWLNIHKIKWRTHFYIKACKVNCLASLCEAHTNQRQLHFPCQVKRLSPFISLFIYDLHNNSYLACNKYLWKMFLLFVHSRAFHMSGVPKHIPKTVCINVGARWSPKEELTFARTISTTMRENITQSFQRIWESTRKIIDTFLWFEAMYTKRHFKLLTTKTLKTSWLKLVSLDFSLFSEVNPWQFYSK